MATLLLLYGTFKSINIFESNSSAKRNKIYLDIAFINTFLYYNKNFHKNNTCTRKDIKHFRLNDVLHLGICYTILYLKYSVVLYIYYWIVGENFKVYYWLHYIYLIENEMFSKCIFKVFFWCIIFFLLWMLICIDWDLLS